MNPGRRDFLRSLAVLAAVGAVPRLPAATGVPPRPGWAIGFDGVDRDLAPLSMQVSGQIPGACLGTLYRNGPALYQRGDQRYGHWFDPDGMIQAFRLDRDAVEHRGRFVRTEKFERESAAGRFLYNGAGSTLSGVRPLRNNESINTANINVQPVNGELLALWEAGAPYRVDPQTLETLGRQRWSEALDGVPFSAHPRRDDRGALWNIGAVPFAGEPLLVLYHIDADGSLQKSRMHRLDFAGYMHDFVLTPRYLVVLNSSAVIGEGETFVDSMQWQESRPSQVLVFDREDFSLVARMEVPAAFVFHFGNGWERGEDICFTACQYESADIVRKDMAGLARQEPGPYRSDPDLRLYRVSPRQGRVAVERLGVSMEFPGFDQRRPFAAQALVGVGGSGDPDSGLSSAVLRVDPLGGASQRYDYGHGTIVEEPLLIPGPDGGYLVHTWLDYRRGRSGLSVLRAGRLADGPVAVASMDRVLPLGFHGCFVAQA